MHIPAPGDPLPAPRSPSGSDVVFTADFASAAQWVAGRSWAYPDGGPENPDDDKLDHLVSDADYSRSGVFRARRRPDGRWNTGLLTTEGSRQGFMVRSGDVLQARVRLPRQVGAWPAIWTWRDGGQEIDVFEYHPDNPDLLEFTNHVRGAGDYYQDPAVRPGAWVDLRTEFGVRSVVWWVNGVRAFADTRGVGRDWRAHLIVNLSVSAGRYHPRPAAQTTEMSYEVRDLVVRRPSGAARPATETATGTATGTGDGSGGPGAREDGRRRDEQRPV
ncbi:family 16 glycosylhydrolase [Streptomyces collinus]|uniref:Beta-glucanase/beta-glucan synthetase n=1 Tax=Streptomyces collinus (strain DSM 40733 / Tue 365) TaxID=1214242 RepID=S5UP23_STRC3|nr:family 16 glycosylhydrolase [Streptomyces collinus]AGS67531.1 beta-glucanase/beta-glucan synthetase [Streptomyces collinus Tu 365]UJA06211.1 glycosyl hydrolase family protein [Streptomyces collinus]UJA12619.1 glycosyl hydrolase family protein [Streptomyces collinus]